MPSATHALALFQPCWLPVLQSELCVWSWGAALLHLAVPPGWLQVLHLCSAHDWVYVVMVESSYQLCL